MENITIKIYEKLEMYNKVVYNAQAYYNGTPFTWEWTYKTKAQLRYMAKKFFAERNITDYEIEYIKYYE